MQNQGTFAWFKSRTFRSSARKLNHERKGRHSRRTRPLTQLRKKEASPCSFSLPASAKFDTPGRQAPAQKREKNHPRKKNESNASPGGQKYSEEGRGDSGEGDEQAAAQKWRRCRAGARPTAPSRTPPPSASPTSTPTSRCPSIRCHPPSDFPGFFFDLSLGSSSKP